MPSRKTLAVDPQQLEGELKPRLDPSLDAVATYRRFCPELTYGRHRGPPTPSYRRAAVIALLYPRGGQWYLPLTLRPEHLNDHAGQVSLPGGAREPGETSEQCALRELNEELGVDEATIRIVSRLPEIFVYPSNFLVRPLVAVTGDTPEFMPNPIEVEQLLEMPITHLLDAGNYSSHTISRRAVTFKAPSILYHDQHVWGATAMILGELSRAMSEILGSEEN